ncbi:transcriptional regulator / sugar kinase NagC [Ligilactobacillus salitolerans]|uniref:Transcriptional regulator / sugar kinase NagC n=1 Tax=Ligilactobacillus salitolerans TaxID=1808352 RepID=A0A401IW99_9LACO|nr:ROK family protein [Ligilactobacillus salitolerans]GBG95789.1 transcriptional regulator / sugar kinase NagC [Ligilactobacillus salitolerans]
MKKYVGIDIGGTSIKYGLVTAAGQILAQASLPTATDKEKVLNDLATIVKQYQADEPELAGIGVSMPGVVEANGMLTTAGAVRCLYGVNLKEELEARTSLPATIENDANAAAIAEQWLGAAQDVHNYLSLVLGTGVGGALVINDQIYRGAHARSGEFGWMLLDDVHDELEDGSLNFQGATVIGLLRVYNLKAQTDLNDAREIFTRAEAGEPVAQSVLEHYFRKLAQGILNLVVSFDPAAVVIGGGISVNPAFRSGLEAAYRELQAEHASVRDLELPPIAAAKLGNDAGMIGAVYRHLQESGK